jgi:mobilization protein NikA
MLMADRDADYYQAHKDDPEEWGDPQPAQKSKKRRLAAMISVRFTSEEEDEVRGAALSKGKSVSQFIRETALREARSGSSKATTVPISAIFFTSTGSFGGTSQTLEGNAVIEVSGAQLLPTTVLSDH